MSPNIHSKLPSVGTTIFTIMSGLAVKLNAVNLGQGYPDYSMSPELVALVNEAMKNEMLGKLKDLGNGLLGKFGLSLDNFKAQKDPNSGSYNISFQK